MGCIEKQLGNKSVSANRSPFEQPCTTIRKAHGFIPACAFGLFSNDAHLELSAGIYNLEMMLGLIEHATPDPNCVCTTSIGEIDVM